MAATGPSATEPKEQGSKSQIVVVDLDEAQPSRLVSRLRKGRGKLLTKVERIVSDLVEAGTIKSSAQPVVLVVREIPSPWSFMDDDEDDD
jgi:hypothetical protein